MSEIQTGGCLCRACRYQVRTESSFQLTCYCRDCQHISGAGHLPQLIIDRSAVDLSGPIKTHVWKSDSDNDITLGFCETCGSPIYKTTTMADGKISLLAGSLDEPGKLDFQRKVYEDRRLPWDKS